MLYGILVLPTQTVADVPTNWDVNVYDDVGDFVVIAGRVTQGCDCVTYTDVEGWSTDFEDIQQASRTLMQADVILNPTGLN